MSLRAAMIRDDSVKASDGGVEIEVHLPWFRSLPLSCVEGCRVVIDGVELSDDMLFRLTDGEWPLSELGDLPDREWFLLDEAILSVSCPAPPRVGETVELSFEIAVRIPDIIIGPGRAFVSRQRVTRRVQVK